MEVRSVPGFLKQTLVVRDFRIAGVRPSFAVMCLSRMPTLDGLNPGPRVGKERLRCCALGGLHLPDSGAACSPPNLGYVPAHRPLLLPLANTASSLLGDRPGGGKVRVSTSHLPSDGAIAARLCVVLFCKHSQR